jgi:glucose-1-phosphate thymidylyltransferase
MKGIVLAGGSGTRLYPLTRGVSKQLLPVYDKPMIYYPVATLMQAGIREILVITTPKDLEIFQEVLEDGSQWGIRIVFETQSQPRGLAEAFLIGEKFLQGEPASLILGDNLFYSDHLENSLKSVIAKIEAQPQNSGAVIFGYAVKNPESYGVVEFDSQGKVKGIEEKPAQPKSQYAVPGIYVYDSSVIARAKALKPSPRGELEITDLNRSYLESQSLSVELLGRGTAWLDTGNPEALLQASQFVQTIEERQGLKVGCPEEIAFSRGWISESELRAQADRLGKTEYAAYLRSLI